MVVVMLHGGASPPIKNSMCPQRNTMCPQQNCVCHHKEPHAPNKNNPYAAIKNPMCPVKHPSGFAPACGPSPPMGSFAPNGGGCQASPSGDSLPVVVGFLLAPSSVLVGFLLIQFSVPVRIKLVPVSVLV